MNILITNDDGYNSKGIRVLADILKPYGNIAVIAPLQVQSGMSMAVSLNVERISFRELSRNSHIGRNGTRYSEVWGCLDATPASCVKFALSTPWTGWIPDVVVSGINHGSNTATASCYSGTLGAAAEAAVNHIPGIGVSICTHDADADFSAVERFFPGIFEKLLEAPKPDFMTYYNVNFPDTGAGNIKGARTGYMGRGHWVREFKVVEPDNGRGESAYRMIGDFISECSNTPEADHLLTENNYISIVPHTLDSTDYAQLKLLDGIDF
ncbi:MAG: 5'/3'-nucleotidase SurE [Candidatus Cryptobacteroides sp.]